MAVSSESVKKAVLDFLKENYGKTELSRKSVREGAANALGCEPDGLKPYKKEIKSWIADFEEQQAEVDSEEEQVVGKKRKRSETTQKSGDWNETKGEYWMPFGNK